MILDLLCEYQKAYFHIVFMITNITLIASQIDRLHIFSSIDLDALLNVL